MSTANKLTYLNETKSKIKDAINIAGANITNEPFRVYSSKLYQQYLDIIKNGTSALYNAMPKVTGTGTELSLKNTANLPMNLELSASESTQDTLLPSEYQQVEYIQSSGTQYINTNFVPNQDTKTTIKFAIFNDTNLPVNRSIFGVRQDYDQNHYGMTISQGTNKYLYSGYAGYSTSTGIILEDEKQYELIKDKNVAFLDENQIIIQAYDNFTCPKSMYLFAMNQNGSTFFQASIKMYYCKIYDNDTLVRDFIPCYRKSDDEIGLYDLVNNVFYTNAGTGTFTKGEDVASPNLDYPQNINVVTGNNSIKVTGRNLLSNNFSLTNSSLTLAKNLDGSCTVNGTTDSVGNDLLMSSNTPIMTLRAGTYIFNFGVNTQNKVNMEMNLNRLGKGTYTLVKRMAIAGTKVTLTFTEDLEIYNVNFHFNSNTNFEDYTIYPMITRIDGDYEPYKEQNFTINLGTLELAKIGDYADKIFNNIPSNPLYDSNLVEGGWYKYKMIEKIEMSTITNLNSSMTGRFFRQNFVNYSGISINRLLSNIFLYSDTVWSANNRIGITEGGNLWFTVDDASLNVNNISSWLENKNAYLYGILQTPTTEQITDTTLISQLEALKNAVSYDDETNISQTNANRPFIISASAIKNSME